MTTKGPKEVTKVLDLDNLTKDLSLGQMNELLAKVQDRIVQGQAQAKSDLVKLVKDHAESHGLSIDDIRESLGAEFFPMGVTGTRVGSKVGASKVVVGA